MIQKDDRNTLHHTWDANKSKYTDGERSLGTLVTKTHDFLEFFLTKVLIMYKCIENKFKYYQ